MYFLANWAALVNCSFLAIAEAKADDKVQPVPWVFLVSTRFEGSKVNVSSSIL